MKKKLHVPPPEVVEAVKLDPATRAKRRNVYRRMSDDGERGSVASYSKKKPEKPKRLTRPMTDREFRAFLKQVEEELERSGR